MAFGTPVSMKSGLEGRNNYDRAVYRLFREAGLNEVRPRRPEQLTAVGFGAFFGYEAWSQ